MDRDATPCSSDGSFIRKRSGCLLLPPRHLFPHLTPSNGECLVARPVHRKRKTVSRFRRRTITTTDKKLTTRNQTDGRPSF